MIWKMEGVCPNQHLSALACIGIQKKKTLTTLLWRQSNETSTEMTKKGNDLYYSTLLPSSSYSFHYQ